MPAVQQNEIPAPKKERSPAMLERLATAVGLLRADRFAEAATALTAILAEEPGWESAADRLKEARAGIPAQARRAIAAGSALEASGDLAGAMSQYEHARQLDPTLSELDSLVRPLRGRMTQKGNELFAEASQYHGRNKIKEAADLYQRVLALLPPDDPKHAMAKSRLDAIRAGRDRKPETDD